MRSTPFPDDLSVNGVDFRYCYGYGTCSVVSTIMYEVNSSIHFKSYDCDPFRFQFFAWVEFETPVDCPPPSTHILLIFPHWLNPLLKYQVRGLTSQLTDFEKVPVLNNSLKVGTGSDKLVAVVTPILTLIVFILVQLPRLSL
jgi:hypothetical protein